jgi:hypothetical protein
METGTAHVSAACSAVGLEIVNGAFPSLRLLTKTYARRFSPTAFFTRSTVSRRISGSSSAVLAYGSARFFAVSYDILSGVRRRRTVKGAVRKSPTFSGEPRRTVARTLPDRRNERFPELFRRLRE